MNDDSANNQARSPSGYVQTPEPRLKGIPPICLWSSTSWICPRILALKHEVTGAVKNSERKAVPVRI